MKPDKIETKLDEARTIYGEVMDSLMADGTSANIKLQKAKRKKADRLYTDARREVRELYSR